MGPEESINYSLSGPMLRASGVDYDVRKDRPYLGYETYDFDVPVYHDGDVWSRYLVRMDEMWESLKICRQALDRLNEPGPIVADHPKLNLPPRDLMKEHIDVMIHHFLVASEGFTVPTGEVYQPIESARGGLDSTSSATGRTGHECGSGLHPSSISRRCRPWWKDN
jgi:NADH-quinone oxidoreductase subunit D